MQLRRRTRSFIGIYHKKPFYNVFELIFFTLVYLISQFLQVKFLDWVQDAALGHWTVEGTQVVIEQQSMATNRRKANIR